MRTRYSPARCCCSQSDVIRCNVDAMAWPKKNLRIDVQQLVGINQTPSDRLVDLEFAYTPTPDVPPTSPFARRWWYAEGQYRTALGTGQDWRFHMGCGDRAGILNTPIFLVELRQSGMFGGPPAGQYFQCGIPHQGTGNGLVTVALTEDPFYWEIEYRSGCLGVVTGDPWGNLFNIQISEP